MELPGLQPQRRRRVRLVHLLGRPVHLDRSGPTAGTIVLAPAIESGVVSRSPVSRMNPVFCNGQAEYEYVYSGCEG